MNIFFIEFRLSEIVSAYLILKGTKTDPLNSTSAMKRLAAGLKTKVLLDLKINENLVLCICIHIIMLIIEIILNYDFL